MAHATYGAFVQAALDAKLQAQKEMAEEAGMHRSGRQQDPASHRPTSRCNMQRVLEARPPSRPQSARINSSSTTWVRPTVSSPFLAAAWRQTRPKSAKRASLPMPVPPPTSLQPGPKRTSQSRAPALDFGSAKAEFDYSRIRDGMVSRTWHWPCPSAVPLPSALLWSDITTTMRAPPSREVSVQDDFNLDDAGSDDGVDTNKIAKSAEHLTATIIQSLTTLPERLQSHGTSGAAPEPAATTQADGLDSRVDTKRSLLLVPGDAPAARALDACAVNPSVGPLPSDSAKTSANGVIRTISLKFVEEATREDILGCEGDGGKRKELGRERTMSDGSAEEDDGVAVQRMRTQASSQFTRMGARVSADCASSYKNAKTVCNSRNVENKAITRKLRAFDRRFSEKKAAKKVVQKDDNYDVLAAIANYKRQASFDDEYLSKMNMMEVSRPFNVVKWSSQHTGHVASNLKEGTGRWESLPGKTKNEFVVFELTGSLATVSAVEFSLLGTSSSPRTCKIQYSEASVDGPWLDAWKIHISDNKHGPFKSHYQYGRAVTQFREKLLEEFGDVQSAWMFLDANSDGLLSFSELQAAVSKLKKNNAAAWKHVDEQRLFNDLDVAGHGEVLLEDMLSKEGPRPPCAPWWRLFVMDNYGSPSCIALCGPVKLFVMEEQTGEANSPLNKTARGGADFLDKSLFGGDFAKVDVDPSEKMLRRLAKEYDIDLVEVEAVFHVFKTWAAKDKLELGKEEVTTLLIHLHGCENADDVSASRMDYFWRQMDIDNSGTVSFEEFMVWYKMYFPSSAAGSKTMLAPRLKTLTKTVPRPKNTRDESPPGRESPGREKRAATRDAKELREESPSERRSSRKRSTATARRATRHPTKNTLEVPGAGNMRGGPKSTNTSVVSYTPDQSPRRTSSKRRPTTFQEAETASGASLLQSQGRNRESGRRASRQPMFAVGRQDR
eukprot:TRINITY_DN38312_c0_g1_i1.p1 TRINITY_DN38312_c0_g1~~TRINITY_DN38312_c0_g1_i1.p1  ORF type:complete len:951 (-),score=192.23 TRINITY_DN38312_c0_g1_i1:269-3121(-)